MQIRLMRMICLTAVVLAAPYTRADADADATTEVNCALGGSAVTGMVVHLDPETGMPTSVPTPEQAQALAALQAAAANRSTKGLVEQPGPTGGVMVNLQSRFRSPVVAVVQEDGSKRVDHLNCSAAGGNS